MPADSQVALTSTGEQAPAQTVGHLMGTPSYKLSQSSFLWWIYDE